MAKKENKFWAIIIPTKDKDGFLEAHPEVEPLMRNINDAYEDYRIKQGKNPHNWYIIINQDELYAKEVWDIILKGEDKKKSTPQSSKGEK